MWVKETLPPLVLTIVLSVAMAFTGGPFASAAMAESAETVASCPNGRCQGTSQCVHQAAEACCINVSGTSCVTTLCSEFEAC